MNENGTIFGFSNLLLLIVQLILSIVFGGFFAF